MNADFKNYLLEAGLEQKTRTTYLNAVVAALRESEDEPWRILTRSDLTQASKITYRAALKRWADFSDDEELSEFLESRKVKKLLTKKGSKLGKTIRPCTREQVDVMLGSLEEWKHTKDLHIDACCLSLFIKLGLRASVDLTWIQKSAVEEALENGRVLKIWTKGNRIRSLPISLVKEELETLASIDGWQTIADLLAPNASKETKHQAAYETVRRRLKFLAEQAGLNSKEIRPHMFRHSAADRLWRSTKDIFLVRDFLGHKDSQTTEKYLGADRTEEIGEALEEIYK